MKPKVHTLFSESNYKLIGIASHLSAHKMSWSLNEELGAKFQLAESLIVEERNKIEPQNFPVYKYEESPEVLFTLYSNKIERSLLLKSLKEVDYIIKYEGELSEFSFSNFLNKVKKIKNILTAFEIDKEHLKSKELSLFN